MDNKPLTVAINIICDQAIVKTFFLLKEEQRDLIIKFINKITGLDYNIVRSDPKNTATPLLLCLGDIVIMRQDWE